MSRRVGLAAVNKKKIEEAKFQTRGAELAEDNLKALSAQLETLRQKLSDFAAKHRHEIKSSPEFRRQFQQMCATIGVDPLASSKGFWSELLGVGDYYYEIAVQVVEVCMANNHKTGGLMSLDELREKLLLSRGFGRNASSNRINENISKDDIIRAVEKLSVLGNGFSLIRMRDGKVLVQSVPAELSVDTNNVIELAERNNGCVSVERICAELGWKPERCRKILQDAVLQGLVWVDDQDPSKERQYWFASLFGDKEGTVEV